MFPERPHDLFPIACRVVNTDQWLVTHFSASWKVSEVKHYILSKVCSPQTQGFHFHFPPRHRPVSPITFASVSEDHTLDSDSDADDVFAFEPARRTPAPAAPATPVAPASPVTAHAVQQYPLLAFSTGQLLEDDYSLAWYHLRPHELLELHPAGAVVRLPREVMAEYVQPYFEARVKALRIVWSDKDCIKVERERETARTGKGRTDAGAKGKKNADAAEPVGPDRSALPVIRRKRKTKLEWKERWLVVSQGMLHLFKERADTTPVHSSALSSLCALRGAEDLFRGTSGPRPSPHVICAKFRSSDSPSSANVGTEGLHDVAASPTTESWLDPWSGSTIAREGEDAGEASGSNGSRWIRRGSKEKEDVKLRKHSSGSPGIFGEGRKGKEKEGSAPRSEGSRASGADPKTEVGEGIWLILDMIDENYYDNLLRVLHRTSPDVATTFVPSTTKPQTPPTPPDSPLLASSFKSLPSLPYPEWRIDIARKAQKAGMGDVGRAMSWIMWGDDREARRRSDSTATTLKPGRPKRGAFDITDHTRGEFGTDDSSDDDLESEVEWDGWAADLQRARMSTGADCASPSPASPPDMQGEIGAVRRRLGTSALSSPSSAESLWRAARDTAPSPLSLAPASPPPDPLAFAPELDLAGGSLLALPVPLSGTTTSTVSARGVVRARSLRAVNEDGRGRGVPIAMAVLAEDADADAPVRARDKGKRRRGSVVPGAPAEGRRGLAKAVQRTKAFSPDRLVKGLDSALEFVEGRYGVGSSSTLG